MSKLVEVTVGRIGRPHGIKGDVSIDVRTDEPGRRFGKGATLLLGEERSPVKMAEARWNRGKLIASFEGYPDRTAVEKLTGKLLRTHVEEDERPSEPDEYFDRQLVGLNVLSAGGAPVGKVAEVLHLPAQDVLQLDTPDGERLVPFVTALVPVVDLAAGHVQLADVEGLLEDLE